MGPVSKSSRPITERPEVTAARLLHDMPQESWSLLSLSREVHLSASQLGRLFTREFGLAPMQYLTRVRSARLAALLQASDRPVGELIREAGWKSRGRVARQFKALTGLHPSAYRIAVRDKLGETAKPACPFCGQQLPSSSR